MLRSQAVPEHARLPAQLGALRGWAASEEGRSSLAPGLDFADVLLAVEGRFFR